MKIKTHSVVYQRNGVCGMGFYVVRFEWKDEDGQTRRMVGHVYPEDEKRPEYYGVVDIDNPTECWRGDHFVDAMQVEIDAFVAKQDAEIRGYYSSNPV